MFILFLLNLSLHLQALFAAFDTSCLAFTETYMGNAQNKLKDLPCVYSKKQLRIVVQNEFTRFYNQFDAINPNK